MKTLGECRRVGDEFRLSSSADAEALQRYLEVEWVGRPVTCCLVERPSLSVAKGTLSSCRVVKNKFDDCVSVILIVNYAVGSDEQIGLDADGSDDDDRLSCLIMSNSVLLTSLNCEAALLISRDVVL